MKIPPHIAWPAFVVGLLTLGVATTFASLIASRSDGGAQVIEDYYQKAVDWDARQALQEASDALGWQVTLSPHVDGDRAALALTFHDADGRPLDGLKGTVRGFRPQNADVQFEAPIEATGPGRYSAAFPAPRTGLWDFEVTAHTPDATFHTVRRKDVSLSPSM